MIRSLTAYLATLAVLATAEAAPNLADRIERPLRYRPEGTDFVIENGAEFFNRPLYGNNTAFRVDAGDKPEFSLYLPGRGGNLRLGVQTSTGAKWLNDAARVVTRYRPGSVLYEISDPLLGGGALHLAVLALPDTEGLVLRAELRGASAPVELVWAYGGATASGDRRDGDIGTESEPISRYFPTQARVLPEQHVHHRGEHVHVAQQAGDHRRPGAAGRAAGRGRRQSLGICSRPARLRRKTDGFAGGRRTGRAADRTSPLYLALQRVARQTDDREELLHVPGGARRASGSDA